MERDYSACQVPTASGVSKDTNPQSSAEYEPPILEKESESALLSRIWQEFSQGKWCFGCTNCNCN